MKLIVFTLLFVTAFLGVSSLAMPGLCPLAIVTGLLFLLLAAMQSRRDREQREDRRWQELQNHKG